MSNSNSIDELISDSNKDTGNSGIIDSCNDLNLNADVNGVTDSSSDTDWDANDNVQLNIKSFKIADTTVIYWNPTDIGSMQNAQLKFNKYQVGQNFVLSDEAKQKLKDLMDDIVAYHVSVCNVCGNKYSPDKPTMDMTEHIKISTQWGYFSDYDYEEHTLILCCTCYKQHIMNSSLGQYVSVKQWH